MISPAVAGQLFTFLGFGWTGVFILVWNLVSVCLEYFLLAKIYKTYPDLATRRNPDSNNIIEHLEESSEETPLQRSAGFLAGLKEAVDGWKIYMNHPVRFAGVGLSCLYMTVLGFDNITYGTKAEIFSSKPNY